VRDRKAVQALLVNQVRFAPSRNFAGSRAGAAWPVRPCLGRWTTTLWGRSLSASTSWAVTPASRSARWTDGWRCWAIRHMCPDAHVGPGLASGALVGPEVGLASGWSRTAAARVGPGRPLT